MSRTLIDPVIEDSKVDDNAVIQDPAPEKEKPEPTDLQKWATSKGFDPSMDPKFLESYRNLEQDRGRLANELGDSRQLMDRVIQLEENRQTDVRAAEEAFELDPTDLLADPTSTLDKYFEQRESKIRSDYDARIAQLEGQLGQSALSARHSDAEQVVNDPAFISYVQENPIRQRVAAAAVQAQDIGALDDLLTDYKASLGSADTVAPQADPGQAGLEAARAASLESAAPSGGTTSGKIFSRAALIRMKIEDPEAYSEPGFQDEMRLAYHEGRVR